MLCTFSRGDRSGTRVAIVALTLLAIPCAARSDETVRGDAAVVDLLLRQTQELFNALSDGKTEVWDRYLHDDARIVDESGNVSSKQQMLESIQPLPEGVSGTLVVSDFDARLHGDVAVTTHVEIEDENYHGHALHCRYRTTDTWLRTDQGWRLLGAHVMALRTDPPAVPVDATARRDYCGTYALTPSIRYEIRSVGDSLVGQQTGRKPEILQAEAPDVLFVAGQPRYRYLFRRAPDGKVTTLVLRREAWDLVWKRTN